MAVIAPKAARLPSQNHITTMEELIKKMLRKRLKKRLGLTKCNVFYKEDRRKFEWVYNAPLTQWRDRIWVCKDCIYQSVDEYDNAYKYLTE